MFLAQITKTAWANATNVDGAAASILPRIPHANYQPGPFTIIQLQSNLTKIARGTITCLTDTSHMYCPRSPV